MDICELNGIFPLSNEVIAFNRVGVATFHTSFNRYDVAVTKALVTNFAVRDIADVTKVSGKSLRSH